MKHGSCGASLPAVEVPLPCCQAITEGQISAVMHWSIVPWPCFQIDSDMTLMWCHIKRLLYWFKAFKVRIFLLGSQSFSEVLLKCCHRRDTKALNCIINTFLHLRIPGETLNYTTAQDFPVLASKDVSRGLQKCNSATFLSGVIIAQFRTSLLTTGEELGLLYSSTARPRTVQALSGKKTIFQRNNNVVQHHLHI